MVLHYMLHKPVSDWLETLPHRMNGLNNVNMYEIPIRHNCRHELSPRICGNSAVFFKKEGS